MITIQEPSCDRLVLTVSDTIFENIWLGCAILFSIWSIYLYAHYPYALSLQKFQGSAAAAAVAALGYAAFFERARFIFDKASQTMQWSRTWITGSKSGTLPFSRIQQVTAMRMIGDSKYYPHRRLSIRTAEEEIFITVAFVPDARGERVEIADRIRKFVGLV